MWSFTKANGIGYDQVRVLINILYFLTIIVPIALLIYFINNKNALGMIVSITLLSVSIINLIIYFRVISYSEWMSLLYLVSNILTFLAYMLLYLDKKQKLHNLIYPIVFFVILMSFINGNYLDKIYLSDSLYILLEVILIIVSITNVLTSDINQNVSNSIFTTGK